MFIAAGLIAILGVALYTTNFAFEVWREGNRMGGVGVGLLALLMLTVSTYVLFR